MSLIDFILQQSLILITLELAAAVMALAVLLLIGLRLRQLIMKRSARRADLWAAQREAAQSQAIGDDDTPTLILAPAKPIRTTAAPQPAKPAAPVVSAAATTITGAELEVSAEMLSLLGDVFVDEKTLERHQLLLKGTSDIDIQDLAMLAQSVADRLNGKAPAEIQRVSGQ